MKYFVMCYLCWPATYCLGKHGNLIGVLFIMAKRTGTNLLRMTKILLWLHYHFYQVFEEQNQIKNSITTISKQNESDSPKETDRKEID